MARWNRSCTWGLIDSIGRVYVYNLQEREARTIAERYPEFIATTISTKLYPKRDVYQRRYAERIEQLQPTGAI